MLSFLLIIKYILEFLGLVCAAFGAVIAIGVLVCGIADGINLKARD
jgi:hypothetical protein